MFSSRLSSFLMILMDFVENPVCGHVKCIRAETVKKLYCLIWETAKIVIWKNEEKLYEETPVLAKGQKKADPLRMCPWSSAFCIAKFVTPNL